MESINDNDHYGELWGHQKTIDDELMIELGNGLENIKIIENFMPQHHINPIKNLTRISCGNGVLGNPQEIAKSMTYENMLIKGYEQLLIAEAHKMYNREFLFDRNMDLNSRPPGQSVDLHTDIISSTLPIENAYSKEEIWSRGYSWSGHLSIIVYLNDSFKGGELVFPELNYSVTPKPGMLIAFPGNRNYKHKINDWEYGFRDSISIWTRFKDFK